MAQPQRLEDLGRIREKIERLLDESEALEAGSMHDETFIRTYKDEEKLDDLFRSLRYVSEVLTECSCIASGYANDLPEEFTVYLNDRR